MKYILIPIVLFLGFALSWINPANNPFYVHNQLKKMKVGDEYINKSSPDQSKNPERYNPDIKERARITKFNPSFLGSSVTYINYTNGKPDTGNEVTLSGSDFFNFFIGK